MKAYYITYEARGIERDAYIDARNVNSAKTKIERQICCKIKIIDVSVIGYF